MLLRSIATRSALPRLRSVLQALQSLPPDIQRPRMGSPSARQASFLSRIGSGLRQLIEGRPGRRFVGEDLQGNKYYVAPPTPRMVAATSSHIKELREVEYAGSSHPEDYVPGRIPADWQAWLSGQIVDPPLQESADYFPAEVPPNTAEAWLGTGHAHAEAGPEAASSRTTPRSLHDRSDTLRAQQSSPGQLKAANLHASTVSPTSLHGHVEDGASAQQAPCEASRPPARQQRE